MNPNTPTLPSAPDIPLHDIKPLIEVPDNSFIWFTSLLGLAAIFILALLYLLWRFLRRSKAENIRKEHYQALQEISFADPKQAAYAMTRYGLTFADDAPRTKESYSNLIERLAPYKYKKAVDPIDDETIGYYRIYIEMIDV
ncbi:MAG: hypothetical protein U9Q62_07925 [Campylobacterota bacterium]|nr:hypothetical protein [Campylobacterota bacterium]